MDDMQPVVVQDEFETFDTGAFNVNAVDDETQTEVMKAETGVQTTQETSVAIVQTLIVQSHDNQSQTQVIHFKHRDVQADIKPETKDSSTMPFDPQAKASKKPPNTAKAGQDKKFSFGEEDEDDLGFDSQPGFTDQERFQFDYLLKRDPLYEFFNLTCQSIILNSPHINHICHIDASQLFKKATIDEVPFNKWATWI